MIEPIAVALGDPAGIGAEITAKAYAERNSRALPPFFAVGSRRALNAAWLGPVETITQPADAVAVSQRALPLIEVEHGEVVDLGQGLRAAAEHRRSSGVGRTGSRGTLRCTDAC